MPRVSERFAAITPSATLAIDAKAKALKASGAPVIGFGAGEPDFPTPDAIVEAAVRACRDPRNHKYSPTGGLPELKEALVAKTARDSGYAVNANQVLVTNGGKQAVEEAFGVLLDPGDEALVPAPYWTTYPEAIQLAGGVPVTLVTDETTHFKVTVEQLDQALTPKTKVLLFVSPSNPTGSVYTAEETRAIGEWCLAHNVWVVTDEIYEHLTYDGVTAESMPVVVPELADTCLVINGVAKTYAMTGWRVGWLIGPPDIIDAATNYQSHATSNVANVSQRAALAAVSGPLDDVRRMRKSFDRRRRAIVSMLDAIDGISCPTPEGAFYVYPNLTGLLNRSLGGRSAATTLELAALVLDVANVAFVPGEAFGTPGYGRFSYALGDDDLAEGIGRVAELVETSTR